jgi:nucleotide-binding universal stress UspA family protein
MSIVLCGVDDTEAGTAVLAAAKAAAERAGAPVVLTYVSTTQWSEEIPAFQADGGATPRLVEFGPPAERLLALADAHDARLIVVGTRARRWRSVARRITRQARCPVMIVGPAADPLADPVTRPRFDRSVLAAAPTPVLVAPG